MLAKLLTIVLNLWYLICSMLENAFMSTIAVLLQDLIQRANASNSKAMRIECLLLEFADALVLLGCQPTHAEAHATRAMAVGH